MLWTVIAVLLVLWLLGFTTNAFALGSLIHILLVIALIVFIVNMLTSRRSS